MLSFLMFFASTGLAVDMHFCQGNMKSLAFFGKAKNCYELATGKKSCPKHETVAKQEKGKDSIRSKKCCASKSVILQSDSDQLIPANALKLNPPAKLFLLAFTATFLQASEAPSTEFIPYFHYKPPLILRDIPVLFESFLL